MSPMLTAAATLPAALNAWLRPCRQSNSVGPTMPSEIAQMSGTKMLDVPPISDCATITTQKLGKNAISSAAC